MTTKNSHKGIYILPNLFTTAALFSGFFAIVKATQGDFDLSALAIFIAMVLDGLDGRVARMTNTTSDFGKEYDSLADMICFGLAPGLLMYEWALSAYGKMGWLVAFFYVAATGLRLARFNVQNVTDKRYFQGLPCPSAAAVAAAWVWSFHDFAITGMVVTISSLVLMLLLSLAQVSNLRYRSFKEIDLKGKVPFFSLIFVVVAFVTIFSDPPRVLLITFFSYLVSGPVLTLHHRYTSKQQRTHKSRAAATALQEEAAKKSTDQPMGQPGEQPNPTRLTTKAKKEQRQKSLH